MQRSALFRAVRTSFVAADAEVVRSRAGNAASRQARHLTFRSLGLLLLAAGVVHATLITLVPATTTPVGRYLFAVPAVIVGAVAMAIGRSREK